MRQKFILTALLLSGAVAAWLPPNMVASTIVNSDVTANATWTAAGSPYILGQNVTIWNGSTLTILPGVQVQCGGYYFYLISLGGGGHLVATGATLTGSSGWRLLLVRDTDCTASLTNCVLQGNGGSYGVENDGGTVSLSGCTVLGFQTGAGVGDGGNITLNGCTVSGCVYPVIWGGGGTVQLSGSNNFTGCTNDVMAVGGSYTRSVTWSPSASQNRPYRLASEVDVGEGATVTILPGTQVQCGGYYFHLYSNGGAGRLAATGATLTGSGLFLLRLVDADCTAGLTNCVLQGNGAGEEGVLNNGGTVSLYGCTVLGFQTGAYLYGDGGSIALNGCTVSGCVYPVSWSGGGTVQLSGSNNFTGCTNDVMAVGGIYTSSVTWSPNVSQNRPYRLTDEVVVYGGATVTILPGTQVQCGGYDFYLLSLQGGGRLAATGATLTGNGRLLYVRDAGCTAGLTNCVLQGSGGQYGVYNDAGTIVLYGCTVLGFQTGVYVSGTTSGNVLSNCNIYGNSSFGVYNAGNNTVIAGNCWWGSPTGPRHPSNPSGRGDGVSDHVDFSNWRTSPWTGVLYVCNVQAAQIAGTELVNISYDLVNPSVAGGSPVVVTVGVSTNGGTNFGSWAVSCSGNVGSGVASGNGRNIVWNAGADYGGQLCSTMRILVTAISGNTMAQGTSPIFGVNTRHIVTGALAGIVTGSGSPVAVAQVRVEGTPFGTNTAGNGAFTLRGVPVNDGYVVTVAASNFVSRRLTGVNVAVGTNNLGSIALAAATGTCRVIRLLPEVNPDVTEVEDGGTGYRYYKVVWSDGTMSAGSVRVSVYTISGDIPQNDSSDIWAGSCAGISDADGLLRVAIPATNLTTSPQTVQLIQSGQVKESFLAKRVPRKYDQVWKHKFGGGVSFKGAVVKAGVEAAYESEIRRHMLGGAVDSEEITRLRSVEGRAGLEVGTGVHLGPVSVGAKVGAGGFVEGEASTTYDLPYGSTDAGINAMKLYVAAGDPLSVFAGPAKGLLDFVRGMYEQQFMEGNLKEANGGLKIGGYTEADVGVGFGLGQAGDVKIGASASAETAAFSEYDIQYKDKGHPAQGLPVSRSIGMAASAEASLNLGLFSPNPAKGGIGFQFFAGVDRSYKSTISKRSDLNYFHEAAMEQKCQLNYGMSVKALPGFGDAYDPDITPRADFRTEFTETLTLAFTNAAGFGELAAREPFWGAVSSGSFGIMLPDLNARMLQSLFDTSVSRGLLIDYDKSVYGAYKLNVGGEFGVDALVAGLSLKLEGELERGAEMKVESGEYWQGRRLALVSYPPISETNIPSKEIFLLEAEWAWYASEPIREALHQATVVVANTVNNVVQAGSGAVSGTLSFGQNVMAGESQIVSSWVAGLEGGGAQPHFALASIHPLGGPSQPAYLPPLGSSNYIYGIAGIFRFASSNVFTGTGTLAICYSDTNVTGLDEADLRIYQLPDGTNRWQLVGGTVDTVAKVVSVTITNLGTYAVAPPLPTGDLWLQPSTNALAADGVSEMTVVVTNLLLNTGASATQPWLYTASAMGVDILSSDADTNTAGVQIVSTNATLTLQLRAPVGGTYGSVALRSVAGDAYGQVGINLLDDAAPAAPAGASASAGQSRIWVSWRTNAEPDWAGYRVHYRAGAAGPPWDDSTIVAVEGSASPVQVTGTNVLLRGLSLGTNYFVAVSAVDRMGNESPLSPAVSVTTSQAVPTAPTGVAARFGSDGTNILMWALSEDDGYNDRDVVHYDILLAVLPGGSYVKVGEVPAGIGLYSGTNPPVAATQYVGYAVSAVDSTGLSSSLASATRFMASGVDVDTDGDGIPDSWMIRYFGHPTGQASDQSFAWNDPAGDGVSNLQKYLLGRNPLIWDNLHFVNCQCLSDGRFELTIFGQVGSNYTLQASTDLVNWASVLNFTCTNSPMYVVDPGAKYFGWRFYRVAQGTLPVMLKLALNSPVTPATNGLGFNLQAPLGFSYVIQTSTDLINWQPFTNFISTNSIMFFRDRDFTNYSRRFYRAVKP